MDRRAFLKTSALAVGLTASGKVSAKDTASAQPAAARIQAKWGENPNVLFILSDQHNAKVMGHQGHPDVKTPNFDRLVKQSVRFDACTTANPICTPSRVSHLSGQYCHNHGYYGLSGPNPGGLPTVLGHFRRSGYRTAALGKIHCPAYWVEQDSDVFHDTCGTSVGGTSKEYAEYLAERNLTELEDHGVLREFGKRGRQTVEGRPSTISYRDGQEGWCVTKGIEFMKECADTQKPFFLHVSLPKPHQCYTPAPEFWNLYDQSKLTLPPNTDYDMSLKAPHVRAVSKSWQSGHWTLFEPKTFEAGRLRKLQGYLGNVSHVDHAVGELMDFLKQSGLEDNTILVYCSDHGDYACEHNIMEKAPGISSDAITRVPLIWQWPGKFKAGHIVKEVVETIDIAPTLSVLAGLEPLQTADGQDLSTMLTGGKGDSERLGLTQFAWSKSIRKGPWRLVTFPKEMFEDEYPDGFGELYNVEKDPYEMKNLYFEKKYADVVRQLERELLEMLITKTRPTIIHGSVVDEPSGPQTKTVYHHTVNQDNKIHYKRVAAAAKHNGYRNYQ